jgi:hypothetical protein
MITRSGLIRSQCALKENTSEALAAALVVVTIYQLHVRQSSPIKLFEHPKTELAGVKGNPSCEPVRREYADRERALGDRLHRYQHPSKIMRSRGDAPVRSTVYPN